MGQTNNINVKTFYRQVLLKNTPFFDHQFIVTFDGAVPNDMKSNPNDPSSFTYHVQSTKVPKIDINEVKMSFLSQEFVIPGGVKYDGTWDVKILIDNDLKQYDRLYKWQTEFSDLAKNGGGTKTIPETYAHVKLLDSTMQSELHDFVLVGIYPTKIPDLSMQYENNATIVDFNCTFTYQYMYYKNDNDPLTK